MNFKRLKVAHIEADNLEVFFNHGIEWMSHLNSDLNQNFAEISTTKDQKPVKLSARSIYLIFYDNQNYERNHLVKLDYSYPEEDFCLFRDFPHSQLVYPIIDTLHLKACTCTLSWLVKYSEMYQKYDTEMFEYIHDFYRINDTLFCQDIFSKCNFSEKLDQCYKHNRIRQRELGFFEEAKLYLNIKLIQYIAEIFLQPFFCVISILTNCLVILTLHNKNAEIKKNLANIMYKHIQANTWFNIAYALIKLMSLINICIYPRTSFCSDIYTLPGSQYFKIYVVYFLGNIVRCGCNCSYLCFSVSRYLLSTSQSSSGVFKSFQKLKLKTFYSLVVILSACFSLFKVFQYKLNSF